LRKLVDMKYLIYLVSLSCLLASCGTHNSGQSAATQTVDILANIVDTTIKPGDDFYKYAVGKWLKNNPIPASEGRWGVGSLVEEENYARLKEISELAAQSNAPANSSSQKIGDFYFSGMDTLQIEKAGIMPLADELKKIDGIKNVTDLMQVVSLYQNYGMGPMMRINVFQDLKKSEQMALYIYQGGLGLPDRDYYFNTDARTVNIRNEYKKYITHMLTHSGVDAKLAEQQTEQIYKLESAMAGASRKLADLRDDYKNYNKMSMETLAKLAPNINWTNLFTVLKVNKADSIIVGQPEFVQKVNSLISQENIDAWKAYLRFTLVDNFADALSSDFDKESFHFRSTVMNGVKEQRPRWKRVLDVEEKDLGFLLGQLYVEKYFSLKTKQRYEKLVNDMLAAYRECISNLSWMSEETKKKALVKLNTIRKKVGYPDAGKWRDYSSLQVVHNSYVQNQINANIWQHNFAFSKLGKPVDREEWDMTPQTYNAYYNPSNNEIVLPAAIFTIPGLADSLADDAIIYSYAGASTIGHELTHGFDDQGRRYDEKGNLKSWWISADEEQFNKRSAVIVDQFNNFIVLDSMHINGSATQGENIADLGGIVVGLEAFKKTEQYKKGEKIGGYTPLQRYFLGYALSWMSHTRDEALARQVMTNVHAPAFLRVVGPFVNIEDFYTAFNIKEGDAMYCPVNKRVKIW
jgi:putative endopeptidase